jgi:hypothetical protein
MFIKTLIPKMEIRAAQLYVSPRTRPLNQDEMQVRALSYLLKEPTCPQAGVDIAAYEMAAQIAGPCVLVPVPNHAGDTGANLRLCKAIAAHIAGAMAADILGRARPVESSCDRHKAGRPPLTIAEHGIVRKSGRLIPANAIWFVDNMTTSGATLEACRAAMGGFGRGLVYADAWQSVCLQNARKAS